MTDHKDMVQQSVLGILNEMDTATATNLLNTTLGYMLEVFKAPESNDETMDLAAYLLQDRVEHFDKDNFADLPNELYPLAIMRTLGAKLHNKSVINADKMSYFPAFQKRYQKYITAKLTRDVKIDLSNDSWYDSHKQHKLKQESVKEALAQGLTCTQWRTQYIASLHSV